MPNQQEVEMSKSARLSVGVTIDYEGWSWAGGINVTQVRRSRVVRRSTSHRGNPRAWTRGDKVTIEAVALACAEYRASPFGSRSSSLLGPDRVVPAGREDRA